jgi:hypothetical protein
MGGETTGSRSAPSSPRPGRRRPAAALAVALLSLLATGAAGCAGRYRGPRSLATIGAVLIGAGGGTWVAGEQSGGRAMTDAGFSLVAAGIVAVVAAGGWMAKAVACEADPDCDEAEQCREIPAPPGGIPYKHCVPR